MKFNRRQKFFIPLVSFLVLAIPFKVMVLIEGFTEVRPVNAIPPLVGFICGPLGSLACGIGNIIGDIFGNTFSKASVLGFIGNFSAAYLPYRLWHIYSEEQPHLHSKINICKYVFICVYAAFFVSSFLVLGVYYIYGEWIQNIFIYVLCNEVGFGLALGMPVFIILTCPDVDLECEKKCSTYLILRNIKLRKLIPFVCIAIHIALLLLIVIFDINPGVSMIFRLTMMAAILGGFTIMI